jgi:hypothetical protein
MKNENRVDRPAVSAQPRRPWESPRVVDLPRLTALTLDTAIQGGGGTAGGGSTVVP